MHKQIVAKWGDLVYHTLYSHCTIDTNEFYEYSIKDEIINYNYNANINGDEDEFHVVMANKYNNDGLLILGDDGTNQFIIFALCEYALIYNHNRMDLCTRKCCGDDNFSPRLANIDEEIKNEILELVANSDLDTIYNKLTDYVVDITNAINNISLCWYKGKNTKSAQLRGVDTQ